MKLARILIPLDGSEMAEAAIAPALEIAQPGSTLILVRAAEARMLPGTDVMDAQIRVVQEAEEYLAGVKDKLERAGVERVDTHVWYGSAAPAVVEAARVHKVDAIVMSTHGRSGLGRIIFGSVAESVLRSTHVPILVVRPSGAPLDTPAGQAEARPAGKSEPSPRTEALR